MNDEGEPFYICPVLEAKVGLFGAKDVKGVVICNPCDGSSTYYDLADVPTWVDRVYDGSLAQKKYDWYGQLSGGYINSKIGNKGCKMTTDDYGYKTIDDDLWIYTGVTSVNGDESNIGFVMMNLRTCESRYYEIAGAEEYSAMASAEGQVQHLGYHAAFPSLINIDGCPTYIMVLKDDGGLVKLYALVNVEKYNIVATGASQKEALTAYRKLLRENGIAVSDVVNEELEKQKTVIIKDIQYIVTQGDTVVYITDEQRNVYKQSFAENESLILLQAGDKIAVTFVEAENGIHIVKSVEKQ